MAASVPSGSDNLRMVMLGNAKVGKSATANVILGRETFRETETTECELQRGRVDDRNVSIIDTPGINSATLSSEQLKTEMRRLFSLSDPGPHVFLLLIRVGNFTEDQRSTVEWIQENFGEEALKFTMLLFTGKEDLTSSQWLKFSQDVKKSEFVEKCGLGYFGINSKREVNPAQISKLLEKIETRIQQNCGQYYSKEMYEEFQKKILEEIEEETRKKDKERKRQEEEEDQMLKMSIKEKEKEKVKEKLHRKNTEPILWTSVRDNKSPITSNPQDVVRRRRHTIENEGQRYSKEMYEELQKRLLKEFEEEKRKKDKERKRQKEEEDQKFKMSIKEMEKEKEKLYRKNTEPILWTSVRDNKSPITSNPQDPIRRRHSIDMIPVQMRTEDHQTRTQLEAEMIRNPWGESVQMERLSINEDLRRQNEKKKKEQEEWVKKGATGGAIPDPGSDLRMVLLGKTGSGKSAAGNLILRREEFSVGMSSKSVTRKCEKYETTVGGRKISVVDTPGLFDTEITEDKLKSTIEQCVELSVPGPHVFLLVIRLGVRFTAEERNAVEWIQENFGEEASKHTIVLFKHADVLRTVQIEQYIGENVQLRQLVKECGGRYHLFNNEDMENRSQVRELLKKMKALSSTYYTNKMYQAVQKRLEEEEEKKRKEEEEKRKQWEEKIQAKERKKFEEENQKLKDKREKITRNQKIAIGAGAGLAVAGAATGAAVAAAVVAEIALVAAVAPVALAVFPVIGAGIGWAVYKKSKNKDGYKRL